MTRLAARSRRPLPRKGFTLTEVLLVLAILGVIAAMVVPNLIGQQKEAYKKTTKMSIKSLEEACKQYAIAHDGDFPQGGQDVLAMLTNPGADKDGKPIPAYLPKLPTDAWNEQLYYEWPNSKAQNAQVPAIWSSGPDHKSDDGNGDDINNWSDLLK